MCKLQQMRWTPRGAHFLAQVRCAVLNGDAADRLNAYEAAHTYQMDPDVEKFLGLYVSMNSFSQLVARSRQRKEPLEEWAPRAGQSILI